MPKFATIEDALTPIGNGCLLVVPREVSGVPMEATRALIRRGVRRLHLLALPTSSLQADLLIGAGFNSPGVKPSVLYPMYRPFSHTAIALSAPWKLTLRRSPICSGVCSVIVRT